MCSHLIILVDWNHSGPLLFLFFNQSGNDNAIQQDKHRKMNEKIETQKFFTKRGLGCLLSKGNQAITPKFESPNGKNTKSKIFLKSVQNWCLQPTWKLNEANSSKIWLESKQIKTNEMKINDLLDRFTSKT